MALKDLKSPGKYAGNVYHVLRRFLDSNVGKKWDKVYARICSVASAHTHLGDEIRAAVEREVDTTGPNVVYPNDFFVDEQGLLRKRPKESWKTRWKKRNDSKPITKINFSQDGKDLWYEYVSVSERWVGFKLQKSNHKEWFAFTRKYIDEIVPVYEYHTGSKIGRKVGTKTVIREEIHRRQCNHKEVKSLRAIAARETKAVLILYYHDAPGLTAVVSSKKW